LAQTYQNRKRKSNDHKLYQIAIYYTKWSYIIPNGRKIYQHFPFIGLPKFTQIDIFGLRINHLATLFLSNFQRNLVMLKITSVSYSFGKKTNEEETDICKKWYIKVFSYFLIQVPGSSFFCSAPAFNGQFLFDQDSDSSPISFNYPMYIQM
jgi:hypothetical protein